jgi:hypothetical protein
MAFTFTYFRISAESLSWYGKWSSQKRFIQGKDTYRLEAETQWTLAPVWVTASSPYLRVVSRDGKMQTAERHEELCIEPCHRWQRSSDRGLSRTQRAIIVKYRTIFLDLCIGLEVNLMLVEVAVPMCAGLQILADQ